MAAAMDLSEFENDPRLFLFTSLTAGSSHIITATSRLETILKANKIPFQAIDTATDEKARRLWQRRAAKKKLPGLVKDGYVIGDLDEVEEWNEFGELKETIGDVPANNAVPAGGVQGINTMPPPLPIKPTATYGTTNITQPPPVNKTDAAPLMDETNRVALPGAAEMAERNKAKASSSHLSENAAPETMSSAPAEKEASINAAKAIMKDHPALDHLSAPASAVQSGTATPQPEQVESAVEDASAEGQHGGSGIRDLPQDEVKKGESGDASVEGGEEEAATKGVGDLKLDGDVKTQEQEAKEPEDAAKSVED